jgi:hypothetical protein
MSGHHQDGHGYAQVHGSGAQTARSEGRSYTLMGTFKGVVAPIEVQPPMTRHCHAVMSDDTIDETEVRA